jgi:hypothetical protein
MGEQVRVTKQRTCGRFSVAKYALATFRYLVTATVGLVLALLLVLLLVEGAAVGAAFEDIRASGNFGGSVMAASAQTKEVFVEGGS